MEAVVEASGLEKVFRTRDKAPGLRASLNQAIVLGSAPVPQPSPVVVQEPVHATNLFIQAGAFLQRDNADRLRVKLSGVGSARVVPVQLGAQRFYRVRLGPIATVAEADAMLGRVIAMGNKDARLVVE